MTAPDGAPSVRAATVVPWAASALWRTVLLALVWWALTEGDLSVSRYGLVLVPAATVTSLVLTPPRRSRGRPGRRLLAVPGLVGWFVGRSVAGGIDVARRALSRPVDLRPGHLTYRLDLPPGLARTAVVDLVSLMPGTLSADLRDDELVVHVLDTSLPVREQLAELERRVACVAGHPHTARPPAPPGDQAAPPARP